MLGSNPGLRLDADAARGRDGRARPARSASHLDPDATTGSLALGQQQQIEIIKALWKGSRVLILDEPTTMLTPQGIAELQNVLRQLKANGLAIIFITHKLHEAIAIGDRVAILKQGRVVGDIDPDVLQHLHARTQLQRRIVGHDVRGAGRRPAADIAELREEASVERAGARHQRRAWSSRSSTPAPAGRSASTASTRVSLQVHGGEILGVGGVDGNGQQALARSIAGQQRLESGDVRVDGRSVARSQRVGTAAPRPALRDGRPARRGRRGALRGQLEHGPQAHRPAAVLAPGRHRPRPHRRDAREPSSRSSTSGPRREETRIGALSGGNIQKALLARELSFEPRVVVFNKPTHGLDVRTIASVRERIRELAERGVGIVVISTDLDELVDLCRPGRGALRGPHRGHGGRRARAPRPASASSSSVETGPRDDTGDDARRDGRRRGDTRASVSMGHATRRSRSSRWAWRWSCQP